MEVKFISTTRLTEFLSQVKAWANNAFATKAQVNAKLTGSYGSDTSKYLRNDGNWAVPPSVTVDSALSSTSTNPVQNKVIKSALDGKAATSAIPTKVSELTNDSGYTTNTGTITGIKMNGASKGTSGVVDLGTVITAHQDISGKANAADLADVATSGSYTDLSDKPTIPAAVTESTVSGWGFTKNTGTYSKPSTGIPKTDLASAVQTSLEKADTALQSHQDISGKVDKINITAQGTQAVYPIKINAQGQITAYGSAVSIPAAVAVKGDSESSYRTGNVNLTKANIGLGNVGNFKAVSTVASQGLTDTEKSNARANIGAGTSSFSGSYTDLSNKPTIPTKVSQLTNDSGYTTNTGTVTKVSTGAGLTGGDVTTTGTIKANLTSETKLTNAAADGTETAGRVYPVRLDTNGKLAVNVPWSNSTYGADRGITNVSGKFGHSNTAITAQTTQAVYPIKIDAYGHITGYGSAVSIPAAVAVKGNAESTYRTGNVNLTPANIGAAASSHTHGNIQNGGTLQTNDVAIASGDKLVITDSSDSNKVARSSLSFDGSTTTQFLSKKGTFETPTVSVTITEDTTFNISGTTFKIALAS